MSSARPLMIGSLLTFSGYILVRAFYTLLFPIRPDPSSPPSTSRLVLLAICMFMTGAGGSAGLSASVNAAAKSFPDKTRASATGTVLAGFGLSAFAFSTVGHLLFKEDAGGFLLLLAIGTGLPMFVGSFVVREVPLTREAAEGYQPVVDIPEILIDEDEEEGSYHRNSIDAYSSPHPRSTSLELTRSRSPLPRGRTLVSSSSKTDRNLSLTSLTPSVVSFTPFQLLSSTDGHLLFVILALLCGTGLMYINNVGTVALALARNGSLVYEKRAVSAWQAKQVATVSVWNSAGRILGGECSRPIRGFFADRTKGLFSDFFKARFHMTRVRGLHCRRVPCTPLTFRRYGSSPSSLSCSSPRRSQGWTPPASTTSGSSRRC